MGLAPYERPVYAKVIKDKLIHIYDDGSILLNQKYFSYTHSLYIINQKFEELFRKPARKPESPITQHEMDVAASIQEVTNEIVLKMAQYVRKKSGMKNLCLAGGGALNVVTMGYIEKYSARVQTVDTGRNPFMHEVIRQYKLLTGCSVIVNTSFNVRGEPIVNTIEDAYRCFMATDMDFVVIGNRLFDKKEQDNQAFNEESRRQWLRRFSLD